MNIETLITIVRPDFKYEIESGYNDWNVNNIEKDLVKKYELIDTDTLGPESIYTSDGIKNVYTIKNTETGKFYQIFARHDSWGDSASDAFYGGNLEIVEVVPTEVTVVDYIEIEDVELFYL